MVFKDLFKRKKESKDSALDNVSYKSDSFLKSIKPATGYVFHSDYFEVDTQQEIRDKKGKKKKVIVKKYGTILSFFNSDGGNASLYPMWGINLINTNLPQDVSMVLLEQVDRWDDDWVVRHQNVSEQNLTKTDDIKKTRTDVQKQEEMKNDLDAIASELRNGASYLNVHFRVLLYADSLKTLDDAVLRMSADYKESFKTLTVAPYHGEQYQEMQQLFSSHEKKRNKGFGFTSTEFAGSYGLVTDGLADDEGTYVGRMTDDVNSSAILFDVDNFMKRVIVAHEEDISNTIPIKMTHAWGHKLMQSALVNNHRVAEVILSPLDMSKISDRDFAKRTVNINMQKGEINMFEMFGDVEDEIDIFNINLNKLKLMVERWYDLDGMDANIIRGLLEDMLIQFYKDKGMWKDNASERRDELKIVGIPHRQVPRLQEFQLYIDQKNKSIQSNTTAEFDHKAIRVLRNAFTNMLNSHGHLFNNYTSPKVDNIKEKQRVVYDISKQYEVDKPSAMALFVNTISFAIAQLEEGDILMIHSCDVIDDPDVKKYLKQIFKQLDRKNIRIVLLYDSTHDMLEDVEFNQYVSADYTILGSMSDQSLTLFNENVSGSVPPALKETLKTRRGISYIRRNMANVVFTHDLRL